LSSALHTLLSIHLAFAVATWTIFKRVVDGRFVDSPATFAAKLLAALPVDL